MGGLTKKMGSGPPSQTTYIGLVVVLVLFSLVLGRMAGIQPTWEWRFFSWHPLLMTMSMVGLMGTGAITKKMGGYTNTKMHGIIGWGAILVASAGLYCIYKNKELSGKTHLTTPHSWCGIGVMASSVGLGMAGGIFLHPDFGVDKTNTLIRKVHKVSSRLVLLLGWITAIGGLLQLTSDVKIIALYAVPLVSLVPFVLM